MKRSFTGKIVTGLGEGKFFMSLPHYKEQIEKKLGFVPFEGTLNLLSEDFSIDMLSNSEKIAISGFEKEGRKFGGAVCYRASVNEINGAIIIPDINKHKEQLELIAPENIRDQLKLKDDDIVEVTLR